MTLFFVLSKGATDDFVTEVYSSTSENYTEVRGLTTEKSSAAPKIVKESPKTTLAVFYTTTPTTKNQQTTTIVEEKTTNIKIKTEENFKPPPRIQVYTLKPLVFIQPTTEEITIFTKKNKTKNANVTEKSINKPMHDPSENDVVKKIPDTKIKFGDSDMVPMATNTIREDDAIVFVTTPKIKTTFYKTDVEKELKMHLQDPEGVKQKIIIKKEEKSSKMIMIAGGAVCVFVAVLFLVLVIKRRALASCVRMRKMRNSANGDSQSDVRFLTGDEVLNFTLASAHDFDEES